MTDLLIDSAGVLRSRQGRTIGTLEPELNIRGTSALLCAPRLLLISELHTRLEEAERRYAESPTQTSKAHSDAVRTARLALDQEIASLKPALQEASDRLLRSRSNSPCACAGACGEDHLGLKCGVTDGERIRRQRGFEGVWKTGVVGEPAQHHPTVVASVFDLGDRALCQRCAWLTMRLPPAARSCWCQKEAGDSPCPRHGLEEEAS